MNPNLAQSLLLAHIASTLYMTGVIWFVQIVHYPLFAQTPPENFPAYEKRNVILTTFVVLPAMFIEAITAFLLFIWPPAWIHTWQLTLGLTLLFAVAISTFTLQVPCHNTLAKSFDPKIHRKLVNTNWVRTILWSLRALLVLTMIWR